MAFQITEQAGKIGLARSPIFFYVYDADQYSNEGFYYVADVYVWSGDEVTDKPVVPTIRLSRYPDAKGGAAFDVGDVCNSNLADHMARENGALFTKGAIFCYVEFGWIDDAGEHLNEDESDVFVVTKGFSLYTDGVNYDPELVTFGSNSRPRWLTDRHTTIRIFDGAYFTLPISYRSATVGMYKVKIWDDNGNSYLYDLSSLIGTADDSSERILQFQCGWNSWLTDNTSLASKVLFSSKLNPINFYYIRGEDNSGNAVTKTFTFELFNPMTYSPYIIQFLNRYGCWDYLICEGRKKMNMSVESSEVFRNPINISIGVGVTIDSDKGQYSVEVMGREGFTINTGWIPEADNELIKQLMMSKRVVAGESDGKTFQPLIIKTLDYQEKTQRGEKLISYELQVMYANDYINSVK